VSLSSRENGRPNRHADKSWATVDVEAASQPSSH